MKTFWRNVAIAIATLLTTSCELGQPDNANRDNHSSDQKAQKMPAIYTIDGMKGIVDSGDEILAMVYPSGSIEWDIRDENLRIAERNLAKHPPTSGTRTRLIRVPDTEDETGARFFYYEREDSKWVYRGVCAGPWKTDTPDMWSSPLCNISYVMNGEVVSLQIFEDMFLAHDQEIRRRVLDAIYGSTRSVI